LGCSPVWYGVGVGVAVTCAVAFQDLLSECGKMTRLIKKWGNVRIDVEHQRTKDLIHILELLLVYSVVHWRILKPIVEASCILSTDAPLFYRTKSAVNIVLLNRCNEMQENGRRYQQKLQRPGLALSTLSLYCF
jgi:hypothetical protein